MNILVVIPTLGYGGAERLLVTLLPKLMSKGVNLKVCVFSTPLDLATELEKEGISIVNLGLKHRWSIFEAIVKLHKEVKIFKPDIVWGHLYFGILYSRFVTILSPKVMLVSVLHDSVYGDYNISGAWYRFRNWIYKRTIFLDNHTIAVSDAVKVDYEEFFGWNNIKTIYNAIDFQKIDSSILNLYDQNIIKDELNIDQKDLLIVVPGRLNKRKGHQYLFQAIEKLNLIPDKRYKIIVAGAGPLKEELQNYARDCKIEDQIIFAGNLNQKILFRIMRISNLVIIPSLNEPFGIVAIEAMYLEKPIIVTAVDGLKEITTDGMDAIQVPVKNPDAIVDGILKILNDPEHAKYLAKNAKKTALTYDANIIIDQWLNVFKSRSK